MKGRMIFAVLFMAIFVPSLVFASPFLTCDPYPTSDGITKFYLTFDGGNPILVPVATGTSGTNFMYDLSAIPIGQHSVVARACRDDATWGEECSDLSAPFAFTRPAKPRAPVRINIVR
jgi:hypothetical protein